MSPSLLQYLKRTGIAGSMSVDELNEYVTPDLQMFFYLMSCLENFATAAVAFHLQGTLKEYTVGLSRRPDLAAVFCHYCAKSKTYDISATHHAAWDTLQSVYLWWMRRPDEVNFCSVTAPGYSYRECTSKMVQLIAVRQLMYF